MIGLDVGCQPSSAEEARQLLLGATRVAVLTGAGVSEESGVPTFRGAGGLWRQFRAEELATGEAFVRNPRLVWEWYDWRRQKIAAVEPNAAHRALAELEQRIVAPGSSQQPPGRVSSFTLITQNVDDLHERAGSRRILRLHGDIWLLRCVGCGQQRRDRSVPLQPLPPACNCGALMRPGVVWFGELLPADVWTAAAAAAGMAEVLLVVGTSAVVQPAASLPVLALRAGARLIELNPEPTPLTALAHVSLQGKASEVLPRIV